MLDEGGKGMDVDEGMHVDEDDGVHGDENEGVYLCISLHSNILKQKSSWN